MVPLLDMLIGSWDLNRLFMFLHLILLQVDPYQEENLIDNLIIVEGIVATIDLVAVALSVLDQLLQYQQTHFPMTLVMLI